MASAMKGRLPGLAAILLISVLVLLALATSSTLADTGESGTVQVQQTTQRSTANTIMAAEKKKLFQCPCSYQYCDGKKWKYCSCNLRACSCSCHNSAQTKIPDGATIQVLPSA